MYKMLVEDQDCNEGSAHIWSLRRWKFYQIITKTNLVAAALML